MNSHLNLKSQQITFCNSMSKNSEMRSPIIAYTCMSHCFSYILSTSNDSLSRSIIILFNTIVFLTCQNNCIWKNSIHEQEAHISMHCSPGEKLIEPLSVAEYVNFDHMGLAPNKPWDIHWESN